MKIYVVFTGGTIGSKKDDNNIINAKEEVSDTFLAEYWYKGNRPCNPPEAEWFLREKSFLSVSKSNSVYWQT